MITVERYHDISCGHRVVGHESKCKFLHGHNYRFTFTIAADNLDDVGRVLDFGVIKTKLCQWLEDYYDHKFLIWYKDPYLNPMIELTPESLVIVPFNPTAENIAQDFLDVKAPFLLRGTGAKLIRCKIEETRKCSATAEISY